MPMTAATPAAEPEAAQGAVRSKSEARGLLLVGLFKMSKAVFFGALAAGALDLVHRNLGDLVQSVVDALPIDPEGHFVSLLLDKADMVSNHHLRQAGMLSFAYALVCVVEGTGLMMRKTWAEYFTVVLTVLALPYEVYELIDHFSGFKVGLLVINLLVLWYLLWLIRRMRRNATAAEE